MQYEDGNVSLSADISEPGKIAGDDGTFCRVFLDKV